MSVVIDELVKDIRNNPSSYTPKMEAFHGLKKEGVEIKLCGNTCLLSICNVYINGEPFPTTYIDRWKVEKAVSWWYRNMRAENFGIRF